MSKLLSLCDVVAYATTAGIDLEFYATEKRHDELDPSEFITTMKVRARNRSRGTFADLHINEKILVQAVVPDLIVADLVLKLVKRLDEIEKGKKK